jgi:hypothetical protein
MNHFIALRFCETQLAYSKIKSFRSRFDHKSHKGPDLHMSLLPPFDLGRLNVRQLDALIDEEADMALGLLEEYGPLTFNGLDFSVGNQHMIFLRPELSPELHHFQEGLYDLLTEQGVIFKRKKGNNKASPHPAGIPLGRSPISFYFDNIVEKAKEEFSESFQLSIRDLVLYEKVHGEYILRRKLFTFPLSQVNLKEEESLNWYMDLKAQTI